MKTNLEKITQPDNTIEQDELESLLGKAVSKRTSQRPQPKLSEDLPDCDKGISERINQAGEIEKSRQDIMLACLEGAKISTDQLTNQPSIPRTQNKRRKAPGSPVRKKPVLKHSQDDITDKKLVDNIMSQIVADDIARHRKNLSEK